MSAGSFTAALFCLSVSISAAGASDEVPGHYYFYKQKRTLTLNFECVALYRAPSRSDGTSDADALNRAGLLATGVARHTIPGWSLAKLTRRATSAADVATAPRRVAAEQLADFVSPVFVGDDGGPLMVTLTVPAPSSVISASARSASTWS